MSNQERDWREEFESTYITKDNEVGWIYYLAACKARRKEIDKLKALILFTDESMENDQCGTDTQIRQWNEFIKCFPDHK